MLSGKRVMVVSPDERAGSGLAASLALLNASVTGPLRDGGAALAALAAAWPDAVVVDYGRDARGLLMLLDHLADVGTPTVLCVDPGLAPPMRSRASFVSVLLQPVPPMRVVGEVAVLLDL
jgi:hypothetical protein